MPMFVFHMSILLLAQAIGWPVTVFVVIVWTSWTWLRRHVREVLRR
ncbi:MAG TPA: hypothetical protein VGF84_09410 [Micromonosporaceae bacterium]